MINATKFVLCVMLSGILTISEAARILVVIPVPSISHQVPFRPFTQELARRGHEVTVVTTDPAFPANQAPANLTEIDMHDSYTKWREVLSLITGSTDIINQIQQMSIFMTDIVEIQLKNENVQKIVHATEKFDLLIIEACIRSSLIFSHFHKVPVITISSFGSVIFNTEAMGIPNHPIIYPGINQQKIHNHTLKEKIEEFYKFLRLSTFMATKLMDIENAMLRRVFGPNIPSIHELSNNIDMMFLNMHPMWSANVPVPPNVISIWGIHKKDQKELPENLKSYLDSSKNGVIYMSFGTNAMPSVLAKDKIQAFVNVFSQLPYDVLWKWDKDELPGRTDNIRIGKWFPQSDLLRHPKIKLFITQGGLQSTEEAIDAGVPLVGVPLVGDQWYNVEMYEHHKIGKELDIDNMKESDIKLAVTTVIDDVSFRQNIERLRSLMRDQPETALDRAIWWTEYVLRHGGAKHLRSPAANITWAQYYEIQLVGTVLFMMVFVVVALLFFVRFVVTFILAPKSKVKQN